MDSKFAVKTPTAQILVRSPKVHKRLVYRILKKSSEVYNGEVLPVNSSYIKQAVVVINLT